MYTLYMSIIESHSNKQCQIKLTVYKSQKCENNPEHIFSDQMHFTSLVTEILI